MPVERLQRTVGPVATNVHVLADPRTREAIAIDAAIPSLAWIQDSLADRGWTLKLIVSTHGHWDHIGDNAAVSDHTGAPIAVHPLDAHRLTNPQPTWAPFEIPPSVPAVELAEGGEIRCGAIRLEVLHTPGHTEGLRLPAGPRGRPAPERRHAVRRLVRADRSSGRGSGGDDGVAGSARRARRRPRGPARPWTSDDDRSRAALARLGRAGAPTPDLAGSARRERGLAT